MLELKNKSAPQDPLRFQNQSGTPISGAEPSRVAFNPMTSGSVSQNRPGSAPKNRNRTPTDSKTNVSQTPNAQQSMVLRNQGSSQGLHTLQQSHSGALGTKDNSKNILTSFRNGPVKIVSNAPSASGSSSNFGFTANSAATQGRPRVSSAKPSQTSAQIATSGARPASAPQKRPSSPQTTNAPNSNVAASANATRVKYGVGSKNAGVAGKSATNTTT